MVGKKGNTIIYGNFAYDVHHSGLLHKIILGMYHQNFQGFAEICVLEF